ncbi:zinc finger BED domain-containing protein RICESLEEPER 2-like protein [Tanacetum coccineum]|uniref:Zinc finger BED domain-containing protein RICESLEEPER 2-like protein n=1 Tax=Tanacetum coccineum TaxID=301880 RepID=A0ABQ4ZK07_9ASTR
MRSSQRTRAQVLYDDGDEDVLNLNERQRILLEDVSAIEPAPDSMSGCESSEGTPIMERAPDIINVETSNSEEGIAAAAAAQQENVASTEEHTPFRKRKRKKTAGVWVHFDEIKLSNGTEINECKHCGEKIKKCKDGSTTPLHRHIKICPNLKVFEKGQLNLNAFPGKSGSSSVMQNWKFDNARMRELVSHMIMVHELPFNFVEYDLFNLLMKEANPAFNKISRASTRQDCISSYEIGRKRIQKLLNSVNRVSVTTDMWTSSTSLIFSRTNHGNKLIMWRADWLSSSIMGYKKRNQGYNLTLFVTISLLEK